MTNKISEVELIKNHNKFKHTKPKKIMIFKFQKPLILPKQFICLWPWIYSPEDN